MIFANAFCSWLFLHCIVIFMHQNTYFSAIAFYVDRKKRSIEMCDGYFVYMNMKKTWIIPAELRQQKNTETEKRNQNNGAKWFTFQYITHKQNNTVASNKKKQHSFSDASRFFYLFWIFLNVFSACFDIDDTWYRRERIFFTHTRNENVRWGRFFFLKKYQRHQLTTLNIGNKEEKLQTQYTCSMHFGWIYYATHINMK